MSEDVDVRPRPSEDASPCAHRLSPSGCTAAAANARASLDQTALDQTAGLALRAAQTLAGRCGTTRCMRRR